MAMNPEPPIEIDLILLEFVERHADTLLKWDIVRYFGENPYGLDTADSIANRIGRAPAVVTRTLDDLALLGLLRRRQLGAQLVYQLTDDAAFRDALSRFLSNLERVHPGSHDSSQH